MKNLTPKLYFLLLILLSMACAEVKIELSLPTPTIIPTATLQPTTTPTPTSWSTPTSTPSPTPIAATATPESACPLSDLVVGQHISASGSYTETQWAASGKMICRIERDSCAYYQLVGILDPTIIFKREEEAPYRTEDILMHPAMLTPLSRLNKLVLAEWDGAVQLRITDAYDSLLEHDLNQTDEDRKYSLHFEGRALDLTTWPIGTALATLLPLPWRILGQGAVDCRELAGQCSSTLLHPDRPGRG